MDGGYARGVPLAMTETILVNDKKQYDREDSLSVVLLLYQ